MDSDAPQYDAVADLYDLAWGDPRGSTDMSAYKDVAAMSDGPILEMGAGTGRVAIELAALGNRVVAMDLSPKMAAIAAQKANKDLEEAKRPLLEIVVGDMCNFDTPIRFGLIILPFSALWECGSKDRVQAALHNPYRLLDTQGTLFFDCSYYGPGGRQKRNAVIHSERRCRNGQGGALIFREADWYDESSGITEKWLYTDVEDQRGIIIDRRTDHIQRVYLTPEETREALVRAGFRPENCQIFGSLDLQTPLNDPSFQTDNHERARAVWITRRR